jgi:hypothetical protein
VIFEVVPKVVVRTHRGKYSLDVISEPPLPDQFNPLILLDGIPIYEFNELLELPPDRFLSIDVFNKLYIHGNAVFSGIVSINSINGDMAGLSLPDKSVVVSLEMPKSDMERMYNISHKPDNIPDLSETLSWKPFGSQSNYNYSFSPNDNQGGVIYIVYGFNSFGQWIYKKESLTFDGESH